MEFDEKTHKVKLETLDEKEAKEYVPFLRAEKRRHIENIADATWRRHHTNDIQGQFWHSAMLRHGEDIKEIDKLIQSVGG